MSQLNLLLIIYFFFFFVVKVYVLTSFIFVLFYFFKLFHLIIIITTKTRLNEWQQGFLFCFVFLKQNNISVWNSNILYLGYIVIKNIAINIYFSKSFKKRWLYFQQKWLNINYKDIWIEIFKLKSWIYTFSFLFSVRDWFVVCSSQFTCN